MRACVCLCEMQFSCTFAEVIKRFTKTLVDALDIVCSKCVFNVCKLHQATKYYTINYDDCKRVLKDDFTPIVDHLLLSSIKIESKIYKKKTDQSSQHNLQAN